MSWHTRLQNILKNDIESRPKALDNLKKEIINKIHGNTNINTKSTIELLNNICEQFKNELDNIELEVTESSYNSNKDKSIDTQFLYVDINIKGNWNGIIHLETSAGIKSSTKEPIYYIMMSDLKIKSKIEEKIKNYYIDTYKIMIEEEFLNLATSKNMYLRLDIKGCEYELWDKKPSDYSDTMSGDYKYIHKYDDDYEEKYLRRYEMYKTLKKINKANNLMDFIKSHQGEGVGYETEKVEWRNYCI